MNELTELLEKFSDSMGAESGIAIGMLIGLGIAFLVAWVVMSIFIYLGVKISGEELSFGGSMLVVPISIVLGLVVNVIVIFSMGGVENIQSLNLLTPILSVVTLAISIYLVAKCSFIKSIVAAVVTTVLQILIVIGLAVGAAVVIPALEESREQAMEKSGQQTERRVKRRSPRKKSLEQSSTEKRTRGDR